MLSFHFCSSFIFALHLLLLFFFIHCFSTSSLTLPWTITGFLHQFYTFSPAHRRVIRDTFTLNLCGIFFYSFMASAKVLSRHFLTTGIFSLTLLHQHFTCVYQDLPGNRQFFLEVCRAWYWSSKHRSGPSVVWFTVIHNLHIQKNSFLNSNIYYHELLVVKNLVYMLLNRFELFSLVQIHM